MITVIIVLHKTLILDLLGKIDLRKFDICVRMRWWIEYTVKIDCYYFIYFNYFKASEAT